MKRFFLWVLIDCIPLAFIATASGQSPYLDSSGKPLVKPELLDSSGKLIGDSEMRARQALAKTMSKVKPGCPCGCKGEACSCDFCPLDQQKYETARRAAVAANLPLVVYVGSERKEVDGAVAVSVATFPGAAKGSIVVGIPNAQNRGDHDRHDLRVGATVGDIRAEISKAARPAPQAPAPAPSYQGAPDPTRSPTVGNGRWITSGSPDAQVIRCAI